MKHIIPRLLFGAIIGMGLLSVSGCDEAADRDTLPRGPVRLAELLRTAEIETPLTGIDAARSLEHLGDVPRESVFAEDFESFDSQAAGWPASAQLAVGELDGRRAFRLRKFRWADRHYWIVPAVPSTHYVFQRLVRTQVPLFADFMVLEARRRDRTNAVRLLERTLVAGRGNALKLHWAEQPEPDGSWQRGSVSFFTTPDTKALVIALRGIGLGDGHPSATRRAPAAAANREIGFDDIRLELVRPTPQQAIALVKAQALASGADPRLGMRKYGQFPPLRKVNEEHTPWDDNFSYRHALYVPPPSDLSFSLTIQPRAVLRFSVCLARETRLGHGARFEILARSDGGEKTVWSKDLVAAEDEWQWHDDRLSLAVFAGKKIELVLRTRSTTGDPHPMWGNPVIDTPPQGAGPRNVILIAVDTLRADRMSCYGCEKDTSPNLDALAADGVRFDQVASNCNWTCPSFASIFTGLVPSRHGVYTFGTSTPLPDSLETLAERFRDHGWATEAIVYKAPLYDGGFEQGFDVSLNVPRGNIRAETNLGQALAWLESRAGGRNFLFLHFDDPHQPFTQPEPFDRTFGENPAEHGFRMPHMLRPNTAPRDKARRDVMRGLYDGEVAYVDDRIGAFLAALKKRGLYDDAVIAFVSDHGEELWEHGGFGHGELRLFDELVRVPLIVKPGAGGLARGKVVATQVRGFDIMPTLLELAGLPVGDGLDAESLVPLLAPDAPDPPDRIAVIETSGRMIAVRNRQWKYVLTMARGGAAVETLFDLQRDPGEKVGVIRKHRAVAARLRLQILDYLLLRKPGRYLVSIGKAPPKPRQRELRARGVAANGWFFGIVPGQMWGNAVGVGRDSIEPVAVCGLQVEGLATTGAERDQALAFRRYEAGELARLLKEGRRGLHFFAGPPSLSRETAPSRTMDLEQLEALRAVGYVGEKKKDG